MKNIGERIKEVRKFNDKTQKIFADEVGITQAHLSGIESGKDNPSKTLLKLINLMYNAPLKWLETGEGTLEFEWDTKTDEGNIIIYNQAKQDLDNFVSWQEKSNLELTTTMLFDFAFILSRVTAYCSEEDEINEYLKYLATIVTSLAALANFNTFPISHNRITIKNLNYFISTLGSINDDIRTINENTRLFMNFILQQLNVDNFNF